MTNQKIYYKLTTHKNQSFIVHNINVLSINYIPHQWVKAPYAKSGYGIHVFDTLKNVKKFLNALYCMQDLPYINLWEVYIKIK